MIFWRKGIFASNSTPTPIHRGMSITIHPPRTAGPSSKPLSHLSLHPNKPPALLHLYFCHPKNTSFHFQALQIHAPMFLSSSPFSSQNNSGNCSSEIRSASSVVLMPFSCSMAPQPFFCSSIAPILHQLPCLSLFFFKLAASFKSSHFIHFILTQCYSL